MNKAFVKESSGDEDDDDQGVGLPPIPPGENASAAIKAAEVAVQAELNAIRAKTA